MRHHCTCAASTPTATATAPTRQVSTPIMESNRWDDFEARPDDIVVALGQDGLVANTLKYLQGQPLVGVNPDPHRYDGVLLPFVLIFMVLLINKTEIMGEWTNSRTFNVVSWATVVIMIGLTLALVGITVRGMHEAKTTTPGTVVPGAVVLR